MDVGNRYYEEMQGEWEEDYSDPHIGEVDGYGEEWNAGREDDHMTKGGGDYEPPLQLEGRVIMYCTMRFHTCNFTVSHNIIITHLFNQKKSCFFFNQLPNNKQGSSNAIPE